mmetsp:Transcript_25696/g.61278  ORF Transcript_25696/g.61278 Transcript_25696/m.61278 type:complete len:427 (+) Transcript_25696:1199-2479(+)
MPSQVVLPLLCLRILLVQKAIELLLLLLQAMVEAQHLVLVLSQPALHGPQVPETVHGAHGALQSRAFVRRQRLQSSGVSILDILMAGLDQVLAQRRNLLLELERLLPVLPLHLRLLLVLARSFLLLVPEPLLRLVQELLQGLHRGLRRLRDLRHVRVVLRTQLVAELQGVAIGKQVQLHLQLPHLHPLLRHSALALGLGLLHVRLEDGDPGISLGHLSLQLFHRLYGGLVGLAGGAHWRHALRLQHLGAPLLLLVGQLGFRLSHLPLQALNLFLIHLSCLLQLLVLLLRDLHAALVLQLLQLGVRQLLGHLQQPLPWRLVVRVQGLQLREQLLRLLRLEAALVGLCLVAHQLQAHFGQALLQLHLAPGDLLEPRGQLPRLVDGHGRGLLLLELGGLRFQLRQAVLQLALSVLMLLALLFHLFLVVQ